MNKKTLYLFCLFFGLLLSLNAFEFQQQKDILTFRAKQTEIKIKNARIIGVKNLQSGVLLADPEAKTFAKTAGVGNMKGKAKEMSNLHSPWGEPSLKLARQPIKSTTIYRYPDAKSKLAVKKEKNRVTAVWKGLTDSKKFYPRDFIKLEISEDKNGYLAIQSYGKTAEKGVFSISVPIENLNGKGKFVLPSFGGMMHAAGGTPAYLRFQDTGLFYEAKFMSYMFKNTSLGYWYEDPTFRPYYAMFERGREATSFGLEINNIMPFELYNEIKSPVLKIATFADSAWVAAARPYRDWYQKTFAKDIAKRDSIAWANKINAICDPGVGSEAAMKRIKELMPTDKILLHVWQARKLGFSALVPDYTLRENYPKEVARAHKHGFKVMCYVCSLCAVYKSPAWERDNLESFFITRKNNINNYGGGKNAFDENLVGTLTAAKGKDQFGHLKKGAFLYCDPLGKKWRDYFSSLVVEVNRSSGTDANYQDTLGCTSDNGNGFIDGLSGAQGNAALARTLAEKVGAPMASEYGPEPIAFAVKWPLNYPQVWGNMEFRRYRIHNQRPLAAFLFGYRTWIPTVNAFDDFHKHLLVACSDALGGFGLFAPSTEIDIKEGFSDHLVLRTKIYVDKELVPYFPERKYPENIIAMYKGIDGIYSYYDDGTLQMMLDPKGKPLYGRVHNVSSIKVKDLCIPHWPSADKDGIYGLNPESSYALYPVENAKQELSIGRLPSDVRVKFCYTAPEYAYIELDGKGSVDLPVKYSSKFKSMYVNDKLVSSKRIAGKLPLRVFLSTNKTVEPDQIVRVNIKSGIADSKFLPMPGLRIKHEGKVMYQLHGYNSTFLDSVFEVKNADDAVEILLRNTQPTDGNGVILSLHVNGLEIASFDCLQGKKPMDTNLRKWRVPLGKFKGQHVLISVRANNKESSVRDQQYVSKPCIVKDPAQKFSETLLKK